jgi:hypothetical protein
VNLGLSFAPLVSTQILWAAIAAAAVLALLLFVSRSRGATMRAAGLALILLALANPSFTREDRDPLSSVAVVVVDKSPSQTFGDRARQTEEARKAVVERLSRVPGLDVRVVEAGQSDGETDGTRLFTALGSTLSDVPADRIAGAIMITDGRVHDVPTDAGALGFAAPVHALITGNKNERDRRVALIAAPRFGIVGQTQTITYQVEDHGARERSATVTVRRDGDVVETRTVPVGTPQRVDVPIPHGGANIVEIEASPLAGELTPVNNRAVVTIDGVRDKLRVLLVSGEPNAGERTWRNLLKSDASVDLVHFTILRPPEKQDGTPINELSLIAFPTRELFETKIGEFDLIIFDRYSNQTILPSIYFSNIVRYVREGGAVLIAAGPEFAGRGGLASSPLGAVMPAQPDGQVLDRPYLAHITEIGQKHPVTRALPGSQTEPPSWGEWLRQISADVKSGSALMSGIDNKPLLVLSREGKGRMALLLSDHAWLWARDYRGGGPHLDLLRRLGHWLMKEPDLEEEALRASTRGGDLVVTRQTMADSAKPVTITTPSGKTETVTLEAAAPGLWQATVTPKEAGLHRLTDGELTAFVSVGPANPREYQEVISSTERLAALAGETGGSVRRVADSDGVTPQVPSIISVSAGSRFSGADFIGIHATDASVVRGVGVLPVFLGFLGLALLAASLLSTWLYEGRFNRSRRGAA